MINREAAHRALEHVMLASECLFCDLGVGENEDEDDGPRRHTDECPLHGYDMTEDFERLQDWAAHGSDQ